jgi:hypothetical protein
VWVCPYSLPQAISKVSLVGGVLNNGDCEGVCVLMSLDPLDHLLVCDFEFGGVGTLEEGGEDAVEAVGVDDGAWVCVCVCVCVCV